MPESFKKILNNKYVLIIAILVQIGLLYGLTYWGYHSSRLPYWFDNFIHKTEIWRVYGKKDYIKKAFYSEYRFDPRLDFIDRSLVIYQVDGFLREIDDSRDSFEIWTIENSMHENVKIDIRKDLEDVHFWDCSDDEVDCNLIPINYEQKWSLNDIEEGDFVEITQRYDVEKEEQYTLRIEATGY